jgi:probable HAF family extracellular repeat protein
MMLDPNGTQIAFLWDPARGLRTLGTLRGTCGGARGLNNRGQVIGWWGDETHLQRPFVWDETTGMRDLGTPDGDEGEAIAINDNGQIVGVLSRQAGGRPTLWTSTGPVPDEGPLRSLWNLLDINNHGDILGLRFASDPEASLVLWRQGDAVKKLFSLDRSVTINVPLLNDANRVMYEQYRQSWLERILRQRRPPPRPGEYYLWDPQRGRIPLNAYVPTKKGERLDLFDLNNDGCIVGRVMGPGEASSRAVLLEPIPERWPK